MKILLINPPSKKEIIANNPPIIEEERGYNPPLGLLYLAAYLRNYSQHQVGVIDSQVEELSYAQLKKKIAMASPDLVGITAMTLTLLDVLETVRLTKQISRKIKVILGGPHVHIFPKETINLPGVNFLVLGEGEKVFCDLVEAIDKKKNLEKVKGIVFKKNQKVVNTGARRFIDRLDEIPFPARDLTPFKKYSSLMAKRQPVTTMITSRGCPFRCRFCDRPNLGKFFRSRSAQNVVDEMEACVKMGIYEFLIYDDTFTVDRGRVIEICQEISKRGLNIGWDIRARVNTVDKKLLRFLKKAGCERIHYGVESGSPKVLRALNKGITIQEIKNAFRWTKQAGIETLAYFMIGNPQEGDNEIRASVKLMRQLEPDYVHLTVLTPFPATPLYLEALAKKKIKKDVWCLFAQKPDVNFVPPIWEENYSRQELFKIAAQIYQEFYMRPGYIFRQLVKVKSPKEAYRKIKAGLKVVGMK